MAKQKKKKKKAVSEMVAYVILISIALGIAIGVYAWLKLIAPGINEPTDCKEGTSVILESASYSGVTNLVFNIKNNGRFDVNGVIVSVGDDPAKVPVTYLMSSTGPPGYYDFSIIPLEPGQISEAKFDLGASSYLPNYIETVQIQPFIKTPKGKKIVCKNTLFTDNTIHLCVRPGLPGGC